MPMGVWKAMPMGVWKAMPMGVWKVLSRVWRMVRQCFDLLMPRLGLQCGSTETRSDASTDKRSGVWRETGSDAATGKRSDV